MCTPENGYPGSPREYTYGQFCRKNGSRSAGPGKASPKARAVAPAGGIPLSSTEKEIEQLEAALQEYSPSSKPKAMAGRYIIFFAAVFEVMIQKEIRLSYPDPIARYQSIVSDLHKKVPEFKTQKLPRQVMFKMVMDHLVALTR